MRHVAAKENTRQAPARQENKSHFRSLGELTRAIVRDTAKRRHARPVASNRKIAA